MNSIPGAAATRASAKESPSRVMTWRMRSKRGEGGVALIEVCHLGLVAESGEGPNATDTEHELLLDAGLLVATVEPGCDADDRLFDSA